MSARVGRGELATVGKRYQDRETSPERTKVWVEPKSKVVERKVPVVYYLSRNGLLEHPHFMEVPLSSPQGLYLRDVINRLNRLRGQGMANMYAWSTKRNYKKGFVWHDLSDDDFIYPAQGQEYVLKGSELLLPSPADSISSAPPQEDAGRPTIVRRPSQSWSHLDLAEYKVYKAEPAARAGLKAADASTQTDDKARRRRRPASRAGDGRREGEAIAAVEETVLSTEEISPPPSTSSPETLESLIKTDRARMTAPDGTAHVFDRTGRDHPSGRMKASTVLMQLISCGSISVKDHGFSLATQYKDRVVPRVSGSESVMDGPDFCRIRLENKEYFSGSLVETAKKGHVGSNGEELIWLKRSSSYNAERSSKLDLMEKGVTAKCIPTTTKSKSRPNKKDTNSAICRSAPSSKRMTEETTK